MNLDNFSSNDAVMKELGARVRMARIAYPLTQAQLAQRAGVSLRTVANLEKGSDSTLGSFISVMRALGTLSRMDLLLEKEEIRPSELVSSSSKRQRVRPLKASSAKSSWKWGDER